MEVSLTELMKKVLADTFALYLKSHNYHWNVEGIYFNQLHLFFGDLYTELHGAIDLIAENIRVLDSYSPGSFKRFSELTSIEDEVLVPNCHEMISNLERDNKIVLNTLNIALKFAEREDNQGIINFLAGRIEIHDKHGWMLRSLLK